MSLLLQITIFLAAVLIIVPFGKRLGIATVLGYLFTGVLLGPSVFNIASDPDAIMHLAEYGVIMLMFLIGIELRPQRLWQMRRSIFVIGSAQVMITGIVLMAIIWLVFKQQLLSSFVIGFALALSSTAFVLQLLSEKQQLNTTHGQQSFSILLLQDIAAIPLLAIIPMLAVNQSSSSHGIAYFALIIAAFTGLFLFSRYVMRPFFRFVAQSGATELITAVGLFIVLGVVLLMGSLGVSTTLGAFLTGVLLADSEFRHEIEASISPFKGLLLGLFFMTVGMTTPLSLFIDMPSLVIGGAVLLLLIKGLVLFGTARFFEYDWRNSLMIAASLAQGGEFAYVLLAVARSEKVLSEALIQPVTLIVTVSMVLTPILYWLVASVIIPRFEKAEQAEYDEMPDQHAPIIIAGFGRFGQIIARLAHMQHFGFTAIDNNLQRIDFVRRYGGKIYYGDPKQPELLRSAGIQHAKIFILTIDDVEDSMVIARHIRLNYPQLTLLARARDRHHLHLLKDLGVTHIWRETYLSSLGMGYRALCELGISEQQAQSSVALFRDYDEQLLEQQQRIYTDEIKVYESYRNFIGELEQLFESDAKANELRSDATGNTSDAAEEDLSDPDLEVTDATQQRTFVQRDRLDIRRNEQD